jgi:papain like cysteine protease AvrRpt2
MRGHGGEVSAGVPGPAGSRLDFSLQKQANTRLCWAAVAASIDGYYRHEPVDQRTLAGQSERNEPRSTAAALDRLGRLRRAQEGPAAFDVIQREIAQRRPIVAGIGLTGSHHAVVIVGWGFIGDREHIRVSDPKTGAVRLWDYNQFKENPCFRWQRTYFTK